MTKLPERSYEQINKDRRHILQTGYDIYPERVNIQTTFNCSMDEPQGRKDLFDLSYLDDANFITVKAVRLMSGLKPQHYTLTSAGINLIETPGKLDSTFPTITISSMQGNLTIGNNNVSNNTVNPLESFRDAVEKSSIPEHEKKTLFDRISAVIDHPLTNFILNRIKT